MMTRSLFIAAFLAMGLSGVSDVAAADQPRASTEQLADQERATTHDSTPQQILSKITGSDLPKSGIGENQVISVEEQTRIASDFVLNICNGGIDPKFYADDMTAWSPLMGVITREEYLPKLELVKQVWRKPFEMTIDTTTAQSGRVALQARSHGVLYDGQEYGNDYLFLIEFNDKGQIRRIREYFSIDQVRDILQPAVTRWKELNRDAH